MTRWNRKTAKEVMDKNFGYVDTIQDYTDGMDIKLGPFTLIDFSKDIQPVIEQGQNRLKWSIYQDIDTIYG